MNWIEREMRSLKRPAIFVAAIAVMYGLYSLFYPTTSYRFKLTLNVNTPQGLKAGSSVMEVRTRRYPAWTTLGESTSESRLTGEAIFVDLGAGVDGKPKNVIALLALGPRGENVDFYLLPGMAFELWKNKASSPDLRRSSYGRALPFEARQQTNYRGDSWDLPKLPVGTSAELRGDLIPTLVTFADLNDPRTARAIRPDDFPKAFGNGFTLREMNIEIVQAGIWPLTLLGLSGEPVSHGIATKLPIKQILEVDKTIRIMRAEDPFRVSSGQLQQGY
jgi:hypothetical protein